MDLINKTRHCAFCLQSLREGSIKLCGKCCKRAYCSRECQTADWDIQEKGQGHKYWCHLRCGEEDLDWEVTTIPGKGLGLIAKRIILANERIIVDACRSIDHPAFNDLMPVGGSSEQKFYLNCIGCSEGKDSVICLRISRANHNCDANADRVYDETFKVVILFAHKNILAGEEICINYQNHHDVGTNNSAEQARMVLSTKWRIICSKTCVCYDKERNELIKRCKELDKNIQVFVLQKNPRALELVDELLINHEILNSGFLNKSRTLNDGIQIAMKERKFELARTYGTKLYAMESVIMLPESADVKKTFNLLQDLSVDPFSLLLN